MPRAAKTQGIIQPQFSVVSGSKTIHVLGASEVTGQFERLQRVDVQSLPEFQGKGIIDPIQQTPTRVAQTVEAVNNFADRINDLLATNDEIVVNCKLGRHRSVVTVISYLVRHKGKSWGEAKGIVAGAAKQAGWELQTTLIDGSVDSLRSEIVTKVTTPSLNSNSAVSVSTTTTTSGGTNYPMIGGAEVRELKKSAKVFNKYPTDREWLPSSPTWPFK